jgi:hypothetical protein
MGARATYYEREGFSLDKNTKIETTYKSLGVDLDNIKTIRLIVLDATVVQAAGAGTNATIVLQYGVGNTPFYTITSADLASVDENGVYIAHLRGSLLPGGVNSVRYVYTAGTAGGGTAGAISAFSVYIDAVDNVG